MVRIPEHPTSKPQPDDKREEVLRVLLPSPIGDIGLELRGKVAIGVTIAPEGEDRQRFTPFVELPRSDFLDEVFGHLSEYFAGVRPSPDLEFDLEPSGVAGFARRVLKETARIPFGRTRTYRKIATAAGRPAAYRQVLAILVVNPIPIVIPCHRVVTNKSGIGSYVGGRERKAWLVKMEKRGLVEG